MALLLLPPPLFLRSALAFFFLSLISCNCNFCWEARLDFFSFCFFLKAAMSIPLTARVNFCTRRVRWKEATERRETTTKNENKRSAVVDGKKEKTYSGPTGTKASGRRLHQHTYFFLLSVVHVFLVKTSPGLCPGQLLWLFSLFVHRFGFFGAQPERLPVTSAAHGAVSRVDTGFREGT